MSENKILYVDDEDINLLLFRNNFKKKYIVLTACDGSEGLKILDENPDTLIIISDMKMPGMNGIEFIKRAKEKYPDKNYYILSGFDFTSEFKEAIDSGLIIQYFRKPFDVDKIHKIIAEAIKS